MTVTFKYPFKGTIKKDLDTFSTIIEDNKVYEIIRVRQNAVTTDFFFEDGSLLEGVAKDAVLEIDRDAKPVSKVVTPVESEPEVVTEKSKKKSVDKIDKD